MSAICQQAAAESARLRAERALSRAFDEALAWVADAGVSKVVGVAPLRAIEGSRPALAPLGSRHPSLRAARPAKGER